MENNNRQGCRWVKVSEKGMPKEIGKVHWRAKNMQGEYEPISAGVAYSTIRNGGVVDFIEYLDESIEPCATSSENYWKQRCEASEAFIEISRTGMFIEVSDDDSLFLEWLSKKRELHNIWQKLKSQTPSPTGDRDCERYKRTIQRRSEAMIDMRKFITALQSQCTEKDQEIERLKEQYGIMDGRRRNAIKSLEESEKQFEQLQEAYNKLIGG